LGKIFDRFYQVENVAITGGGGTGIGLALSKELAELMGGGISVQSTVGKGSTFVFWLPMRQVENGEMGKLENWEDTPIPPSTNSSIPKSAAEQPLVLLVEDNAGLQAFIKQSIEAHWQVVEASNGEEGVQKALELLPDLVISDVMMPLKDGYTLCDELKTNELTAHIPVILLTAKSAIESKLKGLRTGADDYLTKPFNTEELLARMENLVEMRRKLRQHYGSKPVVGEQPGESLSPPDREFLKKFTNLIEAHLSDESLGVEEFAHKMFVSRSQLHRKLKAITDRSATDFIRDYRLERAFAMLKKQEGMVAEVAMRVGFGNEKYFSTVFKEKFGVSPRQVG
jgi:DNA-binding response OmpR family regulator